MHKQSLSVNVSLISLLEETYEYVYFKNSMY